MSLSPDAVDADRALKAKHRSMWASGNYAAVAEELIPSLGPVVVEAAGATTLRLVHRGLPPETVPDHQQGWTYFLDILRDTLSAG